MSNLVNERAMLSPIHLWMAAQGFFTRYEFQTPWGICDLVGVKPVAENVVARAAAGITEPIGSTQNVAVFLAIPSASSSHSISLEKLAAALGDYVDSEQIGRSLASLRKKRMITTTKQGNFRRSDRWIPVVESIVAVEFKLSRVEEVLLQATHHKGITEKSYAALPALAAARVASGRNRERFVERGIGLISLSAETCDILIPPGPSAYRVNPIFELHTAERFWTEILETIEH